MRASKHCIHITEKSDLLRIALGVLPTVAIGMSLSDFCEAGSFADDDNTVYVDLGLRSIDYLS